MGVSYAYAVATSSFGCFIKLFARWRASIYKLIWCDLLLYLLLYFVIHIVYRFMLDEKTKSGFEKLVVYCQSAASLIPLTFVLGFYVAIVIIRWWEQYLSLPWPDAIAILVSALIHGHDERGRVMRRTVMRYVCTCSTMMFCLIAPAVKKRFPTLEKLVECGLINENERVIIRDMHDKFPKYPMNWMPIVWAAAIVKRARREGRIRDDFSMKSIIDLLNTHRNQCMRLMHFDTISIPLLYTQVVTLVVYTYFLGASIGQQWTSKKVETLNGSYIAQYVPIFLILEFIFYMGWLKVAECLICPFGEDDDDFELNWLIDRNLQVSYLVVDEMHHEHPELVKDQYWDEVFPNELPYPIDIPIARDEPPMPSTAQIEVSKTVMSDSNLAEVHGNNTLKVFWRRTESIRYSFSSLGDHDQELNSPKASDVEKGFVPYLDKISEKDIAKFRYQSQIDDYSDEITNEEETFEITDYANGMEFDMLKDQRQYERKLRQKKNIIRTMDTAITAELEMLDMKTSKTAIDTMDKNLKTEEMEEEEPVDEGKEEESEKIVDFDSVKKEEN